MEAKTPRSADVTGAFSIYTVSMIQIYIADALPDERTALRLLILHLEMEVVGEAADWKTTLVEAPLTNMDLLVVDWDLLPKDHWAALTALRKACPKAIVIVLISHLDAREQAVRSSGADAFISKGEMPDRVAGRLQLAAKRIQA